MSRSMTKVQAAFVCDKILLGNLNRWSTYRIAVTVDWAFMPNQK